jgi:hypothetical protein
MLIDFADKWGCFSLHQKKFAAIGISKIERSLVDLQLGKQIPSQQRPLPQR